MKKTLIALAAGCTLAGTAQAQSSVTLYGLIDQGVSYSKNLLDSSSFGAAATSFHKFGKGQYGLSPDNIKGSRWGLTGTEDLGGGMKAVFVLESGLSLQDGASGMFNRQAYIGLGHDQFGVVSLGRQHDIVNDFVAPLAMSNQWAGAMGAHLFDFDNFYHQKSRANTLKYTSANYSGFQFGGTVSRLPKLNGQRFMNNAWSVGAKYGNGPFNLAAGYKNSAEPLDFAKLVPGSIYTGLTDQGIPAWQSSIISQNVVVDSLVTDILRLGFNAKIRKQTLAIGGNYTFGSSVVGAVYSRVTSSSECSATFDTPMEKLKGSGDAIVDAMNKGIDDINKDPNRRRPTLSASSKMNALELNFKTRITPAVLVGAGYVYSFGSLEDISGKSHQVTLGGQYDLSKRTSVYVTAMGRKAKFHAKNEAFKNTGYGANAGILHRF